MSSQRNVWRVFSVAIFLAASSIALARGENPTSEAPAAAPQPELAVNTEGSAATAESTENQPKPERKKRMRESNNPGMRR